MCLTLTACCVRGANLSNLLSFALRPHCSKNVAHPKQPFALRLSSNLLIGISRIYNKQQLFFWGVWALSFAVVRAHIRTRQSHGQGPGSSTGKTLLKLVHTHAHLCAHPPPHRRAADCMGPGAEAL